MVDGVGFGVERPEKLSRDDASDEYTAFRKRMMLAYRFRPNPLVRKQIYEREQEMYDSQLSGEMWVLVLSQEKNTGNLRGNLSKLGTS